MRWFALLPKRGPRSPCRQQTSNLLTFAALVSRPVTGLLIIKIPFAGTEGCISLTLCQLEWKVHLSVSPQLLGESIFCSNTAPKCNTHCILLLRSFPACLQSSCLVWKPLPWARGRATIFLWWALMPAVVGLLGSLLYRVFFLDRLPPTGTNTV